MSSDAQGRKIPPIVQALRASMAVSPGVLALAAALKVAPADLVTALAQTKLVAVDPTVLVPLENLLDYESLAGGEAFPTGDTRPTNGSEMVDFAVSLHRKTIRALERVNIDTTVWTVRWLEEEGMAPNWLSGEEGGWVDRIDQASMIYGFQRAAFGALEDFAAEYDIPVEQLSWQLATDAHREAAGENVAHAEAESPRG